ncbi:hypothetical protein ACX80D_16165 [Arthrobacter sp. Sr24]
MTSVVRLVSVVDINEGSNPLMVSVSVTHMAELDNGQSLLLLDDRGWNSNQPWTASDAAEIQETARTVVGPDEPYGDQTIDDAVAAYWDYIRRILAEEGIKTSSANLMTIKHDVVLSDSVLGRLNSENGRLG